MALILALATTIGLGVPTQATAVLATETSALPLIDPAPMPTITGTARVDSVLTAQTGTWADGVTLSYSWEANGATVNGATGATFTPGAAQLGLVITVVVQGTKDGYEPTAKRSEATAAVAPGVFVASPVPTISGTLRVGRVLTANPGAWSPSATMSYQWRRNGSSISGATGKTYTLTAADRTTHISVRMTARRAGYTALTRTSASTAAVDYGRFSAPNPRISGLRQIGSTLTAKRGTWTPTATYSYRWKVAGVTVWGATSRTFVVRKADYGKYVTVVMTGRRTGYLTASRTSAPAGPITKPFSSTVAPKLSARLYRVGWPVRARVGSWSPTATFTYQWKRNGTPIPGASSAAYKLRSGDYGKRLTVTVTGRHYSYTTTRRTSAATPTILAAPYGFTDYGTPATPPVADYAPAAVKTITDAQWSKITSAGVWRSGECPAGRSSFRRVEVPYWGLDGNTHRGYVIVNSDVSWSTSKIFNDLYAKRFPIHRVEGIEWWGGWEWLASKADATTALNCRKPSEANSSNWTSPHAWGRAIDVNPVQNPYINPRTGTWDPNPPPSSSTPGTIRYGGTAWSVFSSYNWHWSGNESWHDYMHFDTGYPSGYRSGFATGEYIDK